ncbi:Hypothetical predicted protein [Cloeon dipterum]|uniref:Reverse transcriptase domain-containing protein n=1 Tax=Cloeon dipterum TaxID=197152 RepID=A0A8S1E0M8_9INSE|nr:Hypothetical predicted protein [Cloeon dipterum]
MVCTALFRLPKHDFLRRLQQQQDPRTIANPYTIDFASIGVVQGDFNLDADWLQNPPRAGQAPAAEFLGTFSELALQQLVQNATRTTDTTAKILDLVLCDAPAFVASVTIVPGTSDHDAILLDFAVTQRATTTVREFFDFKNADWPAKKGNATAGPDGVQGCVLLRCAAALAPSLARLFNYSLQQCSLPAGWKTFAVVPIPKTGKKSLLENYRPISMTSLVGSFLQGRNQYVVYNGAKSELLEVYSGVVQGSVLGPLLFTKYVADLPAAVKAQIAQYADDVTLWKQIGSSEEAGELQNDLDALFACFASNGMELNAAKCHVMDYNDTERFLGVHVSNDLRWNKHTEIARGKAAKVLSFAARNLYGCTPRVKRLAYLTMVKPLMFYGTPAWHLSTQCNIQKFERVQNRALRFVHGWHVSEKARKELLTVHQQLSHNDLIFFRKCLDGETGMDAMEQGFDDGADDDEGEDKSEDVSMAVVAQNKGSF